VLSGIAVDFLLTNDDGIEAEGLQAFYKALAKVGSVALVAPHTVRSCCSHSVTTAETIELQQVSSMVWKVTGTPADCVRIALKHLRIQPQWILSGVNEGGNLGVDIHYSGTVAGAREAALMGYRSMAISQYLRRDIPRNWDLSAQRAVHAWMSLKSTQLLSNQFWNVNLPVVEDPRAELDIVVAQPEPQMLAYEFTQIRESNSDRPEQEKQTIKYVSDYQRRPRSDNNDVAKCFAGNITASRLSISLF
jgi:5'-nucleotidase